MALIKSHIGRERALLGQARAWGDRGASYQPDVPDLDLRSLLRKFWRGKGLVLAVMCLLLPPAAIYSAGKPPEYTSHALLMVDAPKNQVSKASPSPVHAQPDLEAVNGEIQMIRSRRLANMVIEELELENSPEFNPALRSLPWWQPSRWLPTGWRSFFGRPADVPQADQAVLTRTLVEQAYLGRLSARGINRSRVVEISFTSAEPATAQRVVNTLIGIYLDDQRRNKLTAVTKARDVLQERLPELRRRVEDSERQLEDFRMNSGLVQTNGGLVAAQQLSELSTQLVLTRAKRAEIEASVRQVEAILGNQGDAGAVPAVLNSPLIRTLREQEALLHRKQAELSERYVYTHPQFISLSAELENIQMKMDMEIRRIFQGLRNEADALASREALLMQSTAELEQRLGMLGKAEIKLRGLEREAVTSRTIYQKFLTDFTDLSEQKNLLIPDVQIVSYANLPTEPSTRSPALLLAVAFLGSLVVGLVAVAVRERLDGGFRSQEDVERSLSLVALGMVPTLPRGGKPGFSPRHARAHAIFGEAVRSIYHRLNVSEACSPPKVLVISSAAPAEGKTTLAISLARVAARTGKKVILVDSDFRKPRVHKGLGVASCPGLVEVLSGSVLLESALHKDEASGAKVLFSGEATADSADMFNARNLDHLFSRMRTMADIVIVDSAPLTAVGDGLLLARLADLTLFTVRWAHTRREVVSFAMRQLLDAGCHVAGAVLTRVDLRKHAKYGYGDSGFYRASRKYYLP